MPNFCVRHLSVAPPYSFFRSCNVCVEFPHFFPVGEGNPDPPTESAEQDQNSTLPISQDDGEFPRLCDLSLHVLTSNHHNIACVMQKGPY